MKKVLQYFFPKPETKIWKGFGPAFLVIALGIGSGEFILWPYLSAHYGFGILWGALLGISIQLFIITAVERQTAFLGKDVLSNFARVWKKSFWWILFSTLIGFGWPGFSAMISDLLIQGFDLQVSHTAISMGVLVLAGAVLLFGKSAYKNILRLQKINMSILLFLVLFLFIYYFDFNILAQMFAGIFGRGGSYIFIPAGLSLVTFMGAVAYAGSGGNLLLLNSFYVEQEKKGLTEIQSEGFLEPESLTESVQNTKDFAKTSFKQNLLFFWSAGLLLILLLSYVSFAALGHIPDLAEDFSFLITEANIFRETIHPIIGHVFLISGALALFGVQLGILDFIGRIAGNKPGVIEGSKKQKKFYKNSVLAMLVFGLLVLVLGFSKPSSLILLGSVINAFSMGVLAFLLYLVEKNILPKYISSLRYKIILLSSAIFYIGFFIFVLINQIF